MRQRGVRRGVAILAAVALLAACTPQTRTHGWTPSERDLQQIVPGVDSRATVEDTIGVPTTSALLDDRGFYYVQSTMRTMGWRESEVVARRVVAISFDEAGIVSNIETFGLQDGRVVPIARRVTEAPDSNLSFIRRLFGNIGGLDASQFLGD